MTPSERAAPFLRSVDRAAQAAHRLADDLDRWLDDLDRLRGQARSLAGR